MDRNDRDLRELLNGDTEIPKVVRKKADSAFDAIRTAGRDFNMNPAVKTRNQKKGWGVAVAACLALLVVGTTAAAAGSYYGLSDYFKWRDRDMPENAEKLLDTEVKQSDTWQEEKKGNEYVDFNIRQTLCDKQQMIVEIEAKPVEPDKYFLMAADMMPENHISDFGLTFDGKDMTIKEYADSKGLELLWIGANVDLGEKMISCSTDLKCEPDGSLILIETTDNLIQEKEMTVRCDTRVLPPDVLKNSEEIQPDDYIRDSFTFQVTDNSICEEVIYKPEKQEEIADTKVILDEVVIRTTELGTYAEFRYHYNGDAAKELVNGWPDIVFNVVDENGNCLDSGVGEAGSGTIQLNDGTYDSVAYYGVTKLSDEMQIKAFGIGSGSAEKIQYGIFKVIRQ